jgi:hypothetical protein
MTDLGPNLPVLAGQIAGVGDAAAAAAAGIDDAVTGIVNATDEILDHIGYKNKDGAGQLAYINQNGGLGADTGNWTKNARRRHERGRSALWRSDQDRRAGGC